MKTLFADDWKAGYKAGLIHLRREINMANNVTFNEDLKVKFIKHEEHPELLRQLALEIINNISPLLMEANLTLEEQQAAIRSNNLETKIHKSRGTHFPSEPKTLAKPGLITPEDRYTSMIYRCNRNQATIIEESLVLENVNQFCEIKCLRIWMEPRRKYSCCSVQQSILGFNVALRLTFGRE
ncbi:hypothetical protein CEXT_384351 [Caerostris extrusa]|uniref:Uncharacterized protein n=1 Tax=Caerostris extrusa TaxID=172846 RepID=A0AAV4VLA3_CAEEX|nr:hypothetical protein CEXT_384351 [Caerostris extrusa]